MSYDGDPYHPIVERPWEYEILLLAYNNDPDDPRSSYLDLTLRRGATIRRLRFIEPCEFQVEKGFPQATGGLLILDVRRRQLEGIGVRVADFEASRGKVTFWARAVLDLDSEGCP